MQCENTALSAELAVKLKRLLGDDRVIEDPEERAFYSSDVYSSGALAALVIQPQDSSSLAQAVRTLVIRSRP